MKAWIVLLAALVACAHAWGNQGQGSRDSGRMSGFEGGARGSRQAQGNPQRDRQGRAGARKLGGEGGEDAGKYKTNLYNDEDVYGYDATYPGGEAMFITYKNSDARARRGPEFARSSNSFGGRQGNERSSGRQGGAQSERIQRSSNYMMDATMDQQRGW